MKTIFFTLLLLAGGYAWGQDVTEENYRKEADSLWNRFNADAESISRRIGQTGDKAGKDSLTALFKQSLARTLEQNKALALKYAATPSGLEQCFAVRLDLPDDTLKSVLKRIPKQMRRSPCGKAISLHLKCRRIREGSRFHDFSAVTPQGRPFRLSSLKGKRILLLYGGLGCMGEGGRSALADLYGRTDRRDFEIVVFWPLDSLEQLREMSEQYPGGLHQVSDLRGDFTPFKVHYAAQATPTCFLIDEKGTVRMKTEGFHPDKTAELLDTGQRGYIGRLNN